MNKERFHNTLALSLGYEHILKLINVSIDVDDKEYPDDVKIIVRLDGIMDPITFKASDAVNPNVIGGHYETNNEMKQIIDAVHQAYMRATEKRF